MSGGSLRLRSLHASSFRSDPSGAIATVGVLLAAGTATALPAAAEGAPVKHAAQRPPHLPATPPPPQPRRVVGTPPAPPKVSGPKIREHGEGKLPAASTDEINDLQAQLPLGPGGKGADYVPPATSPKAQALLEAEATGKPVEVTSLRDEHNTVLANPDGTFTAESYVDIEHVKQNGTWVKVDTSLAEATDGTLTPRAVKNSLVLSGGGSGSAAVLSDGTHTVTLPSNWKLPRPTVSGNTATYADVLPNIDLLQSALTSGVEQSLVVKKRPSAALAAWKLPLRLAGLHAVADKTGVITLKDAGDTPVFVSGLPTMIDAKGRVAELSQQLVDTAGGPELQVTPDAGFLSDPATTFPVTIDPSDTFYSADHTYIDSSTPTTSHFNSVYMYVGRRTTQTLRSFIGFNTGASVDGHVNSASLQVHINTQNNSARTTQMWDSSTISSATTWNNPPTIFANWNTQDGTGSGGWQSFNATSMMATFASGNVYHGTVALKAVSETDTSYYKAYDTGLSGSTYNPKIVINYTSAAQKATGLTATQLSTFTPKLSGTSTNADNGNVTSHFYVASPGSSTADIINGTAVTVPSGSPASLTLQGGLVRANTTYTWWMQSCSAAGYCTGPTAHQTFTIDPLLGAGNPNGFFSFTSKSLTDKFTLKVNNATGNLEALTSFLSLPGLTGDVPVGQVYNSLANAAGSSNTGGPGTGYGWQFTGGDEAISWNTDGSINLFLPDGSVQQFISGCGSGGPGPSWCTPAGLDADPCSAVRQRRLHPDVPQQPAGPHLRRHLRSAHLRSGPQRQQTQYSYADQGCGYGQLDTVTSTRGDSAGRVLHVSYDNSAGDCPRSGLSQTDSSSNSRSVEIDQVFSGVNWADPYTVYDADGGQYSLNYASNHDLISVITPDGHETDIDYDSSHRVTRITQDWNGIAAKTDFTYPAVGEVDVKDPNGQTTGLKTKYYSDPYGQITKVIDANNNPQSASWNPDHKVLKAANALNPNPTNPNTSPSTTNTYTNTDESLNGLNGLQRRAWLGDLWPDR